MKFASATAKPICWAESWKTSRPSPWPEFQGLAQIPILKYLFGQTTQDHSENEIIFAIVPHIIRGTEVSEINQRAIDIGTSTTIELRHVSRPQTAPAGSAAPPLKRQRSPVLRYNHGKPAPADQPPAPNAAGGTASFLFDPPTVQAAKGKTFIVNLLLSGAQNVHSVPVQLNYDPKMLQLVNVSNGGFLSQDGQAVALVHREDELLDSRRLRPRGRPAWGEFPGRVRWSR